MGLKHKHLAYNKVNLDLWHCAMWAFVDLPQQYWPLLHLIRSVKPHISLIALAIAMVTQTCNADIDITVNI